MMILMFVVGMPVVPSSAAVVKPAATKSESKRATVKRATVKRATVKPPVNGAKSKPFDAVIHRMRTAGKRIGRREIGPKTRALQQQVVHDLQKLIDQARRGQSRQSHSPRSSARPRGSVDRKLPKTSVPSADGGGKPRSGTSRQSTDRQHITPAPDRRITARQTLVKELWGHLPPALRQRLLNIEGTVPLPQYGQLVRHYFESLAKQDTRKPSP